MRNLNNEKMLRKASLLFILFTMTMTIVNGQCKSWVGSPQANDAENAHSVYRAAMKTNDFKIAFENWQIAYGIAPAADGKRDFHYTDGIKLYKQLHKEETDAAEKKAHAEKILSLYDEAIACYENKGIELNCKEGEDCYKNKVAYLLGRKGYDMFYELNQSYVPNIEVLEKAIELGGNNVEYIALEPLANMIVYQYTKEKVDAEKARQVYDLLNKIANYNIENNEKYGSYYKTAIERIQAKYREIEKDIFDCDFFIKKLKPAYDEDPDNIDLVKDVYNELKRRGCADDVPIMVELEAKYTAWAEKVNAEKKAEFEANNPAVVANQLYKDGDFQGALDKYNEAIEKEEDAEKKAGYYFSKASILFRKMKKYANARTAARESAKLRPNWGRPYMLIGDMYGSTARSCGDAWNQRLAILAAMEKYSYAKSIDPEVAEDANDRLAKYRASMPSQEEGFMRKVKKGDKVKVGCWIGETVTVRFR